MSSLTASAAGNDADQPYMISSLPLVFCDGRPVALESMPDRNLVKFVRFMLKCALGVEESRLRSVRRPSWWPRTVPYFNLEASREVEKGHAERLRELVRCCYRGADCEYLVRFCADLDRHCSTGRMAFKNNFDGSSSLYELATNRLVLTCRNENLEYDRPSQGALSPRRCLLPRQLSRSSCRAGQPVMVLPPTDDIFLCDTCSAEFTSIGAVQAHERQCGAAAAADAGPPSDSESVQSEPEGQCASQTRFLSYVGLVPAHDSGEQPYRSPSKQRAGHGRGGAAGRLRRRTSLLVKDQVVDISSPLGRRLGAGPPPTSTYPAEHERYCEDSERKRLGRQPAFAVTWRPPRICRRVVHGWSHSYCFTAAERAERRRTIRTGLTAQARRLAQTVQPCSVRLTRLTPEQITAACRPRPSAPAPAPAPAAAPRSVWRPPDGLQGLLWRPSQPLSWPGPWRSAADGGGDVRPVTAARGSFASRQAGPPRTVQTTTAAAVARAGVARTSFGRPPLTRQPARHVLPVRGATGRVARGRGSRPPMARAGLWASPTPLRAAAGATRPSWLVAGHRGRVPAARGFVTRGGPVGGAPVRGGVKPTCGTVPLKLTGREVPSNDTVVIDLCSSSDDEDGPPPPPPPPPPREKAEAAAVGQPGAVPNGDSRQSKNACSHWSRSGEGLTNGVSRLASLDAGFRDGGGAADPPGVNGAGPDAAVMLPTADELTDGLGSPKLSVDVAAVGWRDSRPWCDARTVESGLRRAGSGDSRVVRTCGGGISPKMKTPSPGVTGRLPPTVFRLDQLRPSQRVEDHQVLPAVGRDQSDCPRHRLLTGGARRSGASCGLAAGQLSWYGGGVSAARLAPRWMWTTACRAA